MKSYWTIFKKIYEEYHPKLNDSIQPIFHYLAFQEYGIVFNENNKKSFQKYESQNITLDVHEKCTVYQAIMEDDTNLFILFPESEDFNQDQRLENDFYPDYKGGLSYLEACCYHGAKNCFKLLRSKFDSEITQRCLCLSFLGGNQEIMSECLKVFKPDKWYCMWYAIISHNIDFVTYLTNEYGIKVNLENCGIHKNFQAFFVYLDQTNKINKCFVQSPLFNLPYLCEFLLSHGADINSKSISGGTALHNAITFCCKESAKFLIFHGADVNAKDKYLTTPLHLTSEYNNFEIAELLISHGADVNAKDAQLTTPLHLASQYNCFEIVKILLLHGADVNAKDKNEKTPLDFAEDIYLKIADLLSSYGALKST